MRPAVFVYPGGGSFGDACAEVVEEAGAWIAPSPGAADVAIAPLLTRKLLAEELAAPRLGALIFHPSALPYRRGPDAIRRAVAAGERVSASTWFWADAGWDTGPVCEQEVVVLLPGETPRQAYVSRFQPAGLRALRRAIAGVVAGTPRRVPQDEALATYDHALPRVTA